MARGGGGARREEWHEYEFNHHWHEPHPLDECWIRKPSHGHNPETEPTSEVACGRSGESDAGRKARPVRMSDVIPSLRAVGWQCD